MKSRHVLSVGIMMSIVACALGVGEKKEQNQQKEQEPEQIQGPYPADYKGESYQVEHEDNWECGVEIVELKSPNGDVYQVEIPMSCDPRADENLGCPPENITEKSNKKAPE